MPSTVPRRSFTAHPSRVASPSPGLRAMRGGSAAIRSWRWNWRWTARPADFIVPVLMLVTYVRWMEFSGIVDFVIFYIRFSGNIMEILSLIYHVLPRLIGHEIFD